VDDNAADLFVRLAPVLSVRDLAAERDFYERLGLPVYYEGEEYPDFIAFGTDSVNFGIQPAAGENDPPSGYRFALEEQASPPSSAG
jgi:catechol 2,3-dioxygenase-like lactoylglutathione lyase family enzyme